MTPLPYDLYAATELFLSTGRSEAEVLPRIGLTADRWHALAPAYFALLHGDDHFYQVQALWPEHDAIRLLDALIGPRWRFPEGAVSPSRAARAIRCTVLAAPHVGPFADAPWTAVHILNDPVATLRYYSHDGERVFFKGEPLRDRAGASLTLDAASFRHLGGRWYTDGSRFLGQGELRGSRDRWYWWTLEGADPESFRALNLRYAKDAAQAWYVTGKTIRTRSPAAFEIVPRLGFNWRTGEAKTNLDDSLVARDAERVYSYGVALRGADPARFRSLGQDYWTDDQRVWTDDGKTPVEGADAASFLVPRPSDPLVDRQGGDATDRDRPYDRGRPVPSLAAYESWSAFFLARDDRAEWWGGRVPGERGDY